jgi:hypothetical protein
MLLTSAIRGSTGLQPQFIGIDVEPEADLVDDFPYADARRKLLCQLLSHPQLLNKISAPEDPFFVGLIHPLFPPIQQLT